MGRYPNIAPRLERNNLAWTGNGANPQLQNLTITPWDPNFDGGFVCGIDSQVSAITSHHVKSQHIILHHITSHLQCN